MNREDYIVDKDDTDALERLMQSDSNIHGGELRCEDWKPEDVRMEGDVNE